MSSLTDAKVRSLPHKDKLYKVFDRDGLYLELSAIGTTPGGKPRKLSKLWRMKFTVAGVEKRLSFGEYPAVGLAEARRKAQEARGMVAQGVDPTAAKKAARASVGARSVVTFGDVAAQWLDRKRETWAPSTAAMNERRLDAAVLPDLGKVELSRLTIAMVDACVERKKDTPEVARKVWVMIGEILQLAERRADGFRNPVKGHKCPVDAGKVKHHAAILDPEGLGAFLRACRAAGGSLSGQAALYLLPRVAARPGELVAARWDQMDLDAGQWRYVQPKTRHRNDEVHIVPLSRQVVEVLRNLPRDSEWVFPAVSGRSKHMTRGALLAALRRNGFAPDELTAHGFRSTFRSMGRKHLKIDTTALERQLGHRTAEALGEAYDRDDFMPERVAGMQLWSDWLDLLVDMAPGEAAQVGDWVARLRG